MIYNNLIDMIGHTPLLEVCGLEAQKARLLLKIEFFNPGGSVKDRTALNMIQAAEKDGTLKPGATIIEPTSGNTGVGLAWIGAVKGYKTIFTMPETMSIERRRLLLAYGAEIVLTEGSKGMAGAIAKAEELRESIDGAVILGQFNNPANPAVHEATTGEEIWTDTEGKVDLFVAGVGTGGTLTGTSRALKKHNDKIRVVAVEPEGSPVISGGMAGKHKLQGIGAGFIPATFDPSSADLIVTVSDDDAYEATRFLAQRKGLLIGISSGAAFKAAYELACKMENEGKTIVALLPDTGERYLSVENLFE